MSKIKFTTVFFCGLMGITTITPLLSPLLVSAQVFQRPTNNGINSNNNNINTIPANFKIPIKYDEAEKIVVTKDESVALILLVAANIKTRSGQILIPFESKIVGKLEPFENGTRFVAEELIIDENTKYPLDAVSQVFTKTEEIKKGADVGTYLKNAAIGAAAAAAISGITGNHRIGVGEILMGAGAGALGTLVFGQKKVEVIAIDPTELEITLLSNLTFD